MCCEPNGAEVTVNGECPDCGAPTVDGVSVDICGYSEVGCETCGDAPCGLSC